MKFLLNKIVLRRAVGVYLGEQEIVVSVAGVLPTGRAIEVARHRVPYTGSGLAAALPEAMKPFLRKRRRPLPTSVGLPASRLFFGARPVETTESSNENSSEAMLQKALCSPNIRVDDYIINLMKTEVGKRSVAGIAACRKKYMSAVMSALDHCGVRPVRTEPGPCGLLRAAIQSLPTPRKVKAALRILCNENQAMAILTLSDQPLAWRIMELPKDREVATIVSAVRTLQNLAGDYGLEEEIEALIVHDREDLHTPLQDPRFAEAIKMRVFCCKGPAMGPESMAFGIALGALDMEIRAFDLSTSLKPRISFREIFPWWDLLLEGGLLASLGFLLWVHYQNLDHQYRTVQAECDRHEFLRTSSPPALEKEKKELRQKLETVQRFLETRVLWTGYLHDLPSRLPATIRLLGINGQSNFGSGATAEIKKSMTLRAVAAMSSDGTLPREIDVFLKSLRGDPVLLQNFSKVEMIDVRQAVTGPEARAVANFTVLCQSQPGRGGPPAKGAKPSEAKPKGAKPTDVKTKDAKKGDVKVKDAKPEGSGTKNVKPADAKAKNARKEVKNEKAGAKP